MPARGTRARSRPARRRGAGWLLVALPLLAACGPSEKPASEVPGTGAAASEIPGTGAAGTPVVLISVDTLRSDRLPIYGYDAIETPALERLRADSILYQHAYTTAALTLPAHVTALTGLRPDQHGVRDNAGYRLGEAIPYLPELLSRAGYRTGGAISAYVLRGTAGLSRGFESYDDRITVSPRALLPNLQRDGNETVDRALAWIEAAGSDPLFFFFHIYEPHAPNDPPEPFASAYDSPYDGEVAEADAIVGRLLAGLRGLGLYDRALILFFSDHGEGLYDHGDYEHGLLLYREILQVPLLVKLPGSQQAGATVQRGVSLTDVAPTVLEWLGLPVPDSVAGTSLLRARAPDDSRQLFAETLFPRLHFGWHELFSVIEYPYHLIHGPDPELYDLSTDPAETRNLLTSERQAARRLARGLDAYDTAFASPGEVDEETRRGLAALGYVGNVGGVEGPLLDPKTQLHVVERLKEAFEYYAVGSYEEAADAFRDVVTDHPGLVDAWEQLGHSLTALGQLDEALAAFERAMELSGGAPHVSGAVAAVLLRMGRLEEARAHAELAVEGHEMSRDTLAQIVVRSGNLEEAEGLVQKALAGRGTRVDPLVTLAELRLLQNRPEEVLRVTQQASDECATLGIEPPAGLHYLRGSAYARLGDLDQAAGSFRTEIEAFPSDLDAHTRLALVYYLMKRPEEGRAALQRMRQLNPGAPAHVESVRMLRQVGDEEAARRILAEGLARWPQAPGLRALAG